MRNRLSIIFLFCIPYLFAQTDLLIPGILSGPTYNMTLQNGTFQFHPGIDSQTMGVNGPVLGPTLIMDQNEAVSLFVDNQLGEETTIHWHGMHVSAENDGGPHTVINPGEIWNPQFTVLDKAGTYWYHPHLHEHTDEHVSKGLAGFIIVRDEDEALLNLPRTYGVDDFPLVVQTKIISPTGQIITHSNSDTVLTVNATRNASLTVPDQVVRLRLLNGSSQRVFNFGFTGNQSFQLIGSDGGLLNNSLELTRLMLAPGERAEILVDFASIPDSTISLMSYASELPNGIYGAAQPGMMSMQTLNGYDPNPLNGSDFDIMLFNIGEATTDAVTIIPTSLIADSPYPENSVDTTRNFILSAVASGPNVLNGDFLINSGYFDMNVINETITLNHTEIWSITNQSPIAHPFHIHDVQFYILDRNGILPEPTEQGRKDVVLVQPMETVRFITRFEDFANDSVPFMYHCHMLTHEDAGMMGQFIVVDPSTTGTKEDADIPKTFILKAAYPNPFNPSTTLSFELPRASNIELIVFDVQGKQVMRIASGERSGGSYDYQWHGQNEDGEQLPSGMYFARLQSDSYSNTVKLLYLK
ncbi:MAG: multicopper oxidase domain-containing protein [Candidatus Marinimicrobia bacterium]|nr:multicopper oxidase domain-containing protein [Candidatus Neomarinimicrobiota bacterium]